MPITPTPLPPIFPRCWVSSDSIRDHHNQRHRTGGKDQEGSIHDGKTGGQIGHSAGNLGGCSGRLRRNDSQLARRFNHQEIWHQNRPMLLTGKDGQNKGGVPDGDGTTPSIEMELFRRHQIGRGS